MTKKVVVNVYSVTREYGGPEEGGWWYNAYVLEHSEPTTSSLAPALKCRLEKEYDWVNEGNIYSMRGGTQLAVYIENEAGESETKYRPRYE